MSAHTKGPWRFECDLKTHVIRQALPDGEFDDYIATTWGGEREADARLIAAAPELLAALIGVLPEAEANFCGGDDAYVLLVAARAAIEKATGVTS
jgi:hypothetical protein